MHAQRSSHKTFSVQDTRHLALRYPRTVLGLSRLLKFPRAKPPQFPVLTARSERPLQFAKRTLSQFALAPHTRTRAERRQKMGLTTPSFRLISDSTMAYLAVSSRVASAMMSS